MSEEQKIRLGGERDAPTRLIGPHVDVFIDGEPVDAAQVNEANETLGFVDFLIGKATGYGWEIDRDPDTNEIRPRLNRRTGDVEIRLKDGAPKHVREAYEALRRGTLIGDGERWKITDR